MNTENRNDLGLKDTGAGCACCATASTPETADAATAAVTADVLVEAAVEEAGYSLASSTS